jgi:hypothetical protein
MSTSWTRQERRSPRLQVSVPVLVYGRATDDAPFHDITETLSVSTHGGLIVLETAVEKGQHILLANCNTQAEEECRVVYVGPECQGKRDVGIAFQRSAVSFWGLTYDWTRKAWQAGEPRREAAPSYSAERVNSQPRTYSTTRTPGQPSVPRTSLGVPGRNAPRAQRASVGAPRQRK